MKTILVTGKDSQLAQCINDIEYTLPSFKFIYKNSKDLDITNFKSLNDFFRIQKIDFCINCAAYTAVDKAEIEVQKAEQVNEIAPKNLATLCNFFNTTLIHISTDFVFDGEKQSPYTELDQTNPLNVYGQTKLNGENQIIMKTNKYYIIRTSWLYSEYGSNFLKTMLRLTKQKKEISVITDQTGSPTYAKDLAEVIFKIIASKKEEYGIYHYSNNGEVTWFEFATTILQIVKSRVIIKPIDSKGYPAAELDLSLVS